MVGANWQISAGNLSEVLRPVAYALAVLVSTWVLADARRRGLKWYAVVLWAVLTLLFPFIVLPLYLAARIHAAHSSSSETKTPEHEQGDSPEEHSTEEQLVEGQPVDGATPVTNESPANHLRWRRALPLLYAVALSALAAFYFYLDYRSTDARLARAEQAKLYGQYNRAIEEYRAALAAGDDAHTRKLLGFELARANRSEEALEELRAAERGGEPDDKLSFHAASSLDALGRRAEAADEYRRFLQSLSCNRPRREPLCDEASARLQSLDGNVR
ncbi:MAG TPA: hypothetical protein VM934_10525 [Pyrinomonadaceae bacterium]|nr:hypothetical protein [Pyrinomonadaceae bacterium]